MVSRTLKLKPGAHVVVPWGVANTRSGVILEVWGDPATHVRVKLEPLPGDDEYSVLLLRPAVLLSAA